jgi:hypothetical protein
VSTPDPSRHLSSSPQTRPAVQQIGGIDLGSRQERRGPLADSSLLGSSVTARARSLASARRGAAELTAHRRRLLECGAEAEAGSSVASTLPTTLQVGGRGGGVSSAAVGDGVEADCSEALLFRVDPTDHKAGLIRLAAAALGFPPERPRDFPALPLAQAAQHSSRGAARRSDRARFPVVMSAREQSRGAGVTRQGAEPAGRSEGEPLAANPLTATAAHNLFGSVRRAAHRHAIVPSTTFHTARPANLPAFDELPSLTATSGSANQPSTSHSPQPTSWAGVWTGGSGGGRSTTNLHAPPAASPRARVGLIEKSSQLRSGSPPLESTGPTGLTPAGINTQGDKH